MQQTKKIDFAYPIPDPERPTLGRENEIQLLLDYAYKSRMRNLVLVGPAGCGKTHLVREIASRLRGECDFIELSVTATVAGMKFVGDFERRVKTFLRGITRKTIVFIDEIHTICGAGSRLCDRRELDLANILKPYLSDPKSNFAIWGATTPEEYEISIAPDHALSRRLPALPVSPLSRDVLRETMKGMLPKGVPVSVVDDVLAAVARTASADASDSSSAPSTSTATWDKAIDVLDLVLAHLRRTGELVTTEKLLF